MSSVMSIRVNDDEREVFAEMAEFYNGKISSILKRLAIEKFEEDYDECIVDDYISRKNNGTLKTYTHAEVGKILGF